MKLIEGGSLADRLADYKADPRSAGRLLAGVARAVHRGGRPVHLPNREYGLLEQLLLERGRCVSRRTLLERVWGLSSSETNVVDVYVNYLRRKLDDHGPCRLIESVRGQGYRIIADAARNRSESSSRPAGERREA